MPNGDPGAAEVLHYFSSDETAFVRGIVQDLDLQQILRIMDSRDGAKKPFHHLCFVENRELDGHPGKAFETGPGIPCVVLMAVVEVDEKKPVQAKDG
jgi:hypothetical protein